MMYRTALDRSLSIGKVAVTNTIRPAASPERLGQIGRAIHRKRNTRLRRDDCVQLPSAGNIRWHARIGPPLSLAER